MLLTFKLNSCVDTVGELIPLKVNTTRGNVVRLALPNHFNNLSCQVIDMQGHITNIVKTN